MNPKLAIRFRDACRSLILLAGFLLFASGCREGGDRDALSLAALKVAEWVAQLPPPIFLLPIRIAVILLLVGMGTAAAYAQGSRSPHQQGFIAVTGSLVGIWLPLHLVVLSNPTIRAWIFMVSVLICIIAPQLVSFWVTPLVGMQTKLRRYSYYFMGLLLFISLFL